MLKNISTIVVGSATVILCVLVMLFVIPTIKANVEYKHQEKLIATQEKVLSTYEKELAMNKKQSTANANININTNGGTATSTANATTGSPGADTKQTDGSTNSEPTTPSVYLIKPGDTLSDISAQHGYSVDAIANFNEIRDVNMIYSNSALRIPAR